MFFNLQSCPDGWSPLDDARGRVIVGLQPSGDLEGTEGLALSDHENRTHQHTVDPPLNYTQYAPDHHHGFIAGGFDTGPATGGLGTLYTQNVGPWAVSAYNHWHGIDQAYRFTSDAGSHRHTYDMPLTPSSVASTSDVIPYIQLLVCEKD